MSQELGRLIEAWRGHDALSEMLDEFQEILRDGEWMFRTVTAVMDRREKPETAHDAFFARDKEINARERDIRGRIVQHLGPGRDADVEPCLVMMSVVKDAERLGDYCKNILEIAQFLPGCLEHGVYETPLTEMESEIELMFARTKKAFINSDEQVAREAVEIKRRISVKADMLLRQLLEDKNIPVRQAVIYTLLERYFKRVASHLDNIASAVLNPVSDIDMDAK